MRNAKEIDNALTDAANIGQGGEESRNQGKQLLHAQYNANSAKNQGCAQLCRCQVIVGLLG